MAYSFKKLFADVKGTISEIPNTKKNIKSLMAGKPRKPRKGKRNAGGYVQPKKQRSAELDEASDQGRDKKKKKEN